MLVFLWVKTWETIDFLYENCTIMALQVVEKIERYWVQIGRMQWKRVTLWQ